MRFGIRPQAVLLAGVPLAALLALLALATLLIRHTEEAGRANELITQSQDLLETIGRANHAVQKYARSKNSEDLAPFFAARTQLPEEEGRLAGAVRADPVLRARGAAYARNLNRGLDVLNAYTQALRSGDGAATRAIAASAATQSVNADLESSQLAFDAAARLLLPGTQSERRATLVRLERALLVSALAGIILTVLVASLFGMGIVRRLRTLGDNARRLADGVRAVPVGGNDEITELDAIYRAMADRMQTSSRAHAETLEELERERNLATSLQQTLLPEIPGIGGLRIDTAYATPAQGAQIGGDWFDVFPLSDRLVGLSVGDVTGHGLQAVAAMGFLRQAIRIVARLDTNPATVMERVNRIVCDEKGSIASAFFGVYDRETGSLAYALAGHGAPLVFAIDGAGSALAGEGMLLGLDAGIAFSAYERRLEPGDTLVLYTDGIVEVERDYLKGMNDLEVAVRAELRRPSPSANLAEAIQQRIFSENAPRDDSALLLLNVIELAVADRAGHNVWHFDARNQVVARRVKRELLAALTALGPSAPDPALAEIVYGELMSNVVRHTPGSARIYFEVRDRGVVLCVQDRGAPFPAGGSLNGYAHAPDDGAESGRGIFIINSLCGKVRVEPAAGGKCTCVELPSAQAELSGRASAGLEASMGC